MKKNNIKILLDFLIKNKLLKNYIEYKNKSNKELSLPLRKNMIKYKDLKDQLLALKVKYYDDDNQKIIDLLMNNMDSWNALSEEELIIEFDYYSALIYFYNH